MKFIVYSLFIWVVWLPFTLNGQEAKPDSQASLRSLLEVSDKIIERTNQFRRQHDLPSLEVDADLREAAHDFAKFMAINDKYGHRADGNTPAGRTRAAGYEHCAVRENIAYFSSTLDPSQAKLVDVFVEGWIDSPGHRENMLAQYVTETGVAVATNDGVTFYAVQMFGRPRSALIQIQVVNQTTEPVDLIVEAADSEDEVTLEPRMRLRMKRCFPTTLSLTGSDKSLEVTNYAQFTITNDGLNRESATQP